VRASCDVLFDRRRRHLLTKLEHRSLLNVADGHLCQVELGRPSQFAFSPFIEHLGHASEKALTFERFVEANVSSQLLRYIEILLISPWTVELGEKNGYAMSPKRTVQIANPASFLAQKIIIHEQRDYRDRAKDLLYTHDTIEVFSETLDELQKLFRGALVPKLHPRRVAELEGAADRFFGKVEDTIREAARMATGRKLNAERLAETAHAGLKEVFGRKAA
jgi:Nucleotidyltransferase